MRLSPAATQRWHRVPPLRDVRHLIGRTDDASSDLRTIGLHCAGPGPEAAPEKRSDRKRTGWLNFA